MVYGMQWTNASSPSCLQSMGRMGNSECERVITPGVEIIPQLLLGIWCINTALEKHQSMSQGLHYCTTLPFEILSIQIMTFSVFPLKEIAIKRTAHFFSAEKPSFPNVDGDLNSSKLLDLTLLKVNDYSARWYGKVISPRGEKVQAQHETNLKFKVWDWSSEALYSLIRPTVECAGKQIAIFASGEVREHLIFPFGPSKPFKLTQLTRFCQVILDFSNM